MTGQLPLDLAHRPNFAEEDFLAAPSNEQARAMVRLWPDWPHKLLLLTGPRGAGKSHLGAIWARRTGAQTLAACDLSIERLPDLVGAPAVLVEDADQLPLREKELFHLVNLAMEQGVFLLVTARKSPDAWGLATKDLLSRLRRAPAVAIEQPDDVFLRAILVKLFHDRQIKADASLIDYLAARLERSFGAAQQAVAALDREGLARGRAITRALAAEMLKAAPELAATGDDDPDDPAPDDAGSNDSDSNDPDH